MENEASPKIIAADHIRDAVVVAFEDGVEVAFPAEFLYALATEQNRVRASRDLDLI